MDTGQILFQANKRQREQLKELVSLLVDLMDNVENRQDTTLTIDRAKRYLLIETNLMDYIDD